MLGRLARWLRILGHDVAYGPHLRGDTLLACARSEGRMILTRDTRLVRRRNLPPHVFIVADRFRDQLRQLADTVPLGGGVLRRCLDCNQPLETLRRDEVRDRVPSYVFETQPAFWGCPRCHHLFWAATHREHIVRELAAMGLAGAVAA
jgi:uncharacterized protein with PIN domain